MSLLILNRIENDSRSPYLVSAEISLGGRPEQIMLDLSWAGIIAYERMPDALSYHDSARKAIIDLMVQEHDGVSVALPVDLSDVVRHGNERWPLRHPVVEERPALAAAAAAVALDVRRVEHDQPDLGFSTVHLDFEGVPTVVIIDQRGGPQREARFRFVKGVHPWQLAPVEQYALLVAVATAMRP